MAEASSATATVAKALSGAISSVGESSLTRVMAGVDAATHNLIDGVVSPTTRRIVMSRGYEYRNNGTTVSSPVLTSQQLQVTKTSLDPRIVRIQRDAVNLLTRACQTSDAMHKAHPTFEDVGAVHMRLTLPVPNTTKINGFKHMKLGSDKPARPGPPSPAGRKTDRESSTARVAESCKSEGYKRCYDPMSSFFEAMRRRDNIEMPGPRTPLERTRCIDPNRDPLLIGSERQEATKKLREIYQASAVACDDVRNAAAMKTAEIGRAHV